MNKINNDNDIIVICPHCKQPIVVNEKEINCAIFRHAMYVDSGKQIDPHSPKDVCETLVKDGKVYGCAKPFKLVRVDSVNFIAEKCEYI